MSEKTQELVALAIKCGAHKNPHSSAYLMNAEDLARFAYHLSDAQKKEGDCVYLVATGETYEGRDTYTRHEVFPPPLCDAECLYAEPLPQDSLREALLNLSHSLDDAAYVATEREIAQYATAIRKLIGLDGKTIAQEAAAELATPPAAAEAPAGDSAVRKALSAMLTHFGMDEDEWNKPTFDQARAALATPTDSAVNAGAVPSDAVIQRHIRALEQIAAHVDESLLPAAIRQLAEKLRASIAPKADSSEPRAYNRAREMADRVHDCLDGIGTGWNEDDIDAVQSKLLPEVYDCLNLLALAHGATPSPASAQVGEVSDAMVKAYLDANDAYWREVDSRPAINPSKWRNGTPTEATRVSLRAALSTAQPQADSSEPRDIRLDPVFQQGYDAGLHDRKLSADSSDDYPQPNGYASPASAQVGEVDPFVPGAIASYTPEVRCVCGAHWECGQHGWEMVHAPDTAQPQADAGVSEQCGWIDEFGNVFPLAAHKPGRVGWMDSHKAKWQPVYRGISPAPKEQA